MKIKILSALFIFVVPLFFHTALLNAKSSDYNRRKAAEARAKEAEARAKRAEEQTKQAQINAERARMQQVRETERARIQAAEKKRREEDAKKNRQWDSVMFRAARQGNVQLFEDALINGADIYANTPESNGDTILHASARIGKTDFVRLLVEGKKFDVNRLNSYMQTPLFLASMAGYDEIVKILLDNHADMEKMCSWNQTALQVAVRHNNVSCVKLLLQAGAKYSSNLDKLVRTDEMKKCLAKFKDSGKKTEKTKEKKESPKKTEPQKVKKEKKEKTNTAPENLDFSFQ